MERITLRLESQPWLGWFSFLCEKRTHCNLLLYRGWGNLTQFQQLSRQRFFWLTVSTVGSRSYLLKMLRLLCVMLRLLCVIRDGIQGLCFIDGLEHWWFPLSRWGNLTPNLVDYFLLILTAPSHPIDISLNVCSFCRLTLGWCLYWSTEQGIDRKTSSGQSFFPPIEECWLWSATRNWLQGIGSSVAQKPVPFFPVARI